MSEGMQKYEFLALLPLSATEDELKVQAGKIEERLKSAGANIIASTPLTKGRLAYEIGQTRQGYYHTIQFEMDPNAVAEFRHALILSGEILRFGITKVKGEFKAFVPYVPKEEPAYARAAKPAVPEPRPTPPQVDLGEQTVPTPAPAPTLETPAVSTAPEPPVQEKPAPAPKVSMEELDKKLEEILGE